MIDTHCHLNFHAYKKDVDEVIKKTFEAGVTEIINIGTKLDSSQSAIELAEKYDPPAHSGLSLSGSKTGGLYATVGVHPHHADKLEDDWESKLKKLAKNKKVVAIGECGMDFYSYESNDVVDPKLQKEVFIKQVELAHKLELPLQIHNRRAGKEILEILQNYKSSLSNPPGVFHCFSGDIDFLKKVLNLGFYIGFDGNITYKGLAKGETTSLSDLVKYTPIDRILTETDSPFLTPFPHRGERNTPEYVIIVGKAIAKIKAISFDEVNQITSKNANKLFKFI